MIVLSDQKDKVCIDLIEFARMLYWRRWLVPPMTRSKPFAGLLKLPGSPYFSLQVRLFLERKLPIGQTFKIIFEVKGRLFAREGLVEMVPM